MTPGVESLVSRTAGAVHDWLRRSTRIALGLDAWEGRVTMSEKGAYARDASIGAGDGM